MNSSVSSVGDLFDWTNVPPVFGPVSVWVVALLLVLALALGNKSSWKYRGIPAVGPTGFISTWKQAFDFPRKGMTWLAENCSKHVFRIPTMSRWQVIITGRALVEELIKEKEAFSFPEAIAETLQAKYMLGPTVVKDRYHVIVVRNQLTRNLGFLFGDIRDEIIRAIEDNIPVTDDWTSVKAYPAMTQIVARTSNRIFVGQPLCRDPDFTSIVINHALAAGKGIKLLVWFPAILKPFAAKHFTAVSSVVARAASHLRPIIEERKKLIDEYGKNYPEKPADLLSWLLDEAEGEERSVEALTNRVIHLNFAAIHTSSMSFTHALYHLAAQPEFIAPLREEIESVVGKEGWSKASLSKMRRLDSLFKESQRLNGVSGTLVTRKAVKDYTFSDGTFVPKGSLVSPAAYLAHRNENVYENPEEFDPFRFSKIRELDGFSTTNQFVNTNLDYIAFGHGSHACPGRFFVANEMKLMMAHTLLEYDIRTVKEGVRPRNTFTGFQISPDMQASILFRRRRQT